MHLQYPITSDLLTTTVAWGRFFHVRLKNECGLSISQYRLLDYLERNRHAIHINELADSFDVKPSAITFTANRLVEKGLLTRSEGVLDRRKVYLCLEDSGHEAIKRANRVEQEVSSRLLSPLGRYLNKNAKAGSLSVLHEYGYNEKAQTYSTAHSVIGAAILNEQRAHKEARRCGISLSGFRILFYLYENAHCRTASEIAKSLLLQLTDINSACNQLSEASLVHRHRSTLDRRSISIELTSNGFQLLEEITPIIDKVFFDSACMVDEETRLSFQKGCRIMAAELRKDFTLD